MYHGSAASQRPYNHVAVTAGRDMERGAGIEGRWGVPRPERIPSDLVRWWTWAVAVLLFGVGDVVTTHVGLGVGGVTEASPLAPVVWAHGLTGMVGVKLAVFVGCYLLWRRVPWPYDMGAPIGLAVLGGFVTGWNATIVLIALQ